MKLLYINYIQGRYGDRVHTEEFIRHSRKLVDTLTVHTPNLLLQTEQQDESRKKRNPLRRLASYYLYDLFYILKGLLGTAWKEWRLLRKEKPDVVIMRLTHNFSAIFLCKMLGIPLIVELNAPVKEMIEYDLWHKHYPRLLYRLERWMLGNAAGIMCVTEALCNYVKQHQIPYTHLISNQNGVDITNFDHRLTGGSIRHKYRLDNQFVIGFTGFFKKWHKIDLLIRGLAATGNEHIVLLLVGDGDDRKYYEEVADIFNVRDRVIITGLVPHKQIPDYIAAFDAGVIAFHQDYCSPIKIFEYMAMKKPVIAVDVPGIREVLDPEKDEGMLVLPNDESALGGAFNTLAENQELCGIIAESAYQKVVDTYLWEHNAERAVNLCRNAMGNDAS